MNNLYKLDPLVPTQEIALNMFGVNRMYPTGSLANTALNLSNTLGTVSGYFNDKRRWDSARKVSKFNMEDTYSENPTWYNPLQTTFKDGGVVAESTRTSIYDDLNISNPFNGEETQSVDEQTQKDMDKVETFKRVLAPKYSQAQVKYGADSIQRAFQAVDYLKQHVPEHVAYGIVGNLMQESGLNPTISNKTSGAYGIYQLLGSRKRGYEKYAAEKGVDKGDMQTQLEYLVKELSSTEKKAMSKLAQTKDINEATVAFRKYFERPGESEARDDRRLGFANTLFAMRSMPKLEDGGLVNNTGYTPGTNSFNNPVNIIPSNNITMKNTPFPVLGVDNKGNKKIMNPGENHIFEGNSVLEVPLKTKTLSDGTLVYYK